MYVRPDAGRRQRAFLLLDESAQLNQPVVFKPEQAGWWYIDLVDIREQGDTRVAGLPASRARAGA